MIKTHKAQDRSKQESASAILVDELSSLQGDQLANIENHHWHNRAQNKVRNKSFLMCPF